MTIICPDFRPCVLIEVWNSGAQTIQHVAFLRSVMTLLKHLHMVAQDVPNHLALTVGAASVQAKHKGLSLGDLVFD